MAGIADLLAAGGTDLSGLPPVLQRLLGGYVPNAQGMGGSTAPAPDPAMSPTQGSITDDGPPVTPPTPTLSAPPPQQPLTQPAPPMAITPSPAASPSPSPLAGVGGMLSGLATKINTPDDNGMSWANKLQLLGAQFQDLQDGGDRGTKLQGVYQKRQDDAESAAQRERLFGLAKQVFPNDPKMQLLFGLKPEALATAIATQYETRNTAGGSSVYTPGPNGGAGSFTVAPLIRESGDGFGMATPNNTGGLSATYSQNRQPTYGEVTQADSEAERQRHDLADEGSAQVRNLIAKAREARVGAKKPAGGGGAAGLPAGFVVEH